MAEVWLSLQKAAQKLGVHPATLRRWADDGTIACTTTAGGHRRFAQTTLDAFMSRAREQQPEAAHWASLALSRARQDVARQPDAHWLQTLDTGSRDKHREVGRKLMGLTLQYVSAPTEDDGLLNQAREVGREYALLSKSHGTPLRDALEAALFFRDRLLEATWTMPQTTRNDNRLDRRINTLLNTVQLAIAEVYE
jgi:excisionase family DNA binding protein